MAGVNKSSVYAKASPTEYSDKEWYHGEMTADKAERELRACGHNCFLVRESKGALILSLLHNGEAHHFNIEYGPGSYRLQASSSQEKFSELTELVAHCLRNAIKITLGVACKKSHTTRDGAVLVEKKHHKDTSAGIYTKGEPEAGIYMKGEPEDLTKYNWYHGEMTEKEAENLLLMNIDTNGFLVRQSSKGLILSMRLAGYHSHINIMNNASGYSLEGRDESFQSIPEMITHYKMFPIKGTQLLGSACDKKAALELASQLKDMRKGVVFKEKESQFGVSWRSCADLPAARSASHVVRIGNNVYVGGGFSKREDIANIFRYNFSEDTWRVLQNCPTYYHGLATLNGRLLAIGGKREINEITNVIYTFMNGMWEIDLPPMPTPRFLLSTLSHNDKLIIAAGGVVHYYSDGKKISTDVVEVYKERQWFTTKRLPFPTHGLSTSIIEDTCYAAGGVGTEEEVSTISYTTLSSLIDNAEPADSNYSMPQVPLTWKKLPSLNPLFFPSNIVEIKGKLATMGGTRLLLKGTTFISTYNSVTNTWVECEGAELPVGVFRSTLLKLDDKRVMLIGGETKTQEFSAKVFLGTIV